MALDSKRAFNNIINVKRRLIDNLIDSFIYKSKEVFYKDTFIYLIFAEGKFKMMPNILYVGKTTTSPIKRYKQHISSIQKCLNGSINWSSKYIWMHNVINSGADLRIMILNRVPKIKCYEIENEWIEYLKSHNFQVINKRNDRYYNRKIYNV